MKTATVSRKAAALKTELANYALPAIYIAQTAEPMNDLQRIEWIRRCCSDAKGTGVKQLRVTIHETIPHLVLFEAWDKVQSPQPEPEWQLQILDKPAA